MMHLEILQVPDYPNVPLLEQRIEHALSGVPIEWELRHVIIEDPRSAALAGMAGSPTLLVDGRDPFAEPDQMPSVSCRLCLLYTSPSPRDGLLSRMPSSA